MTSASPRFGVNYTPSENWFHHWLDFDLDAVRRDFDGLAELGLDHVRLFAIWPYFQPNRSLVRGHAVEQLLSMVDAAGERGMDCSVDALQGHLSSFDFLPAWTQSWHGTDLFTDPRVIEGQQDYLRTVARALAGRDNVLGMSVGNEFSQFANVAHPGYKPLGTTAAHRWLGLMLEACEEGAPGLAHCHSEYDAAFFGAEHPFTPAATARQGAMTTIHSWVFNGTAQRYGGMSQESVRLAEYLIQLGQAWAVDPTRSVWLQEIGAPAPHIPAEDAAEFARQSVAHALDSRDVWGVTWWCSHDVSRSLAGFPALEYSLGLIRNDRSHKDLGCAFAELAGSSWETPEPRRTALVLDVGAEEPDDGAVPHVPALAGPAVAAAGRPSCAPGGGFFDAWMRLAKAGARPAVVLASKSTDAAHLTARGITDVLRLQDL
ncbi:MULTISPECIES: glycosyl hydrolase [Arthrobacter]|uniref:Glycosyl hydrolase n=2 Tax=Arthrobacter TaxID=1663 RepID=A0ABU9KQX5_9MICC|nr:glycosyl hydrolase [Arthrobacter sp. YJM1]MDP5228098.1 glycosyl hydrolase [Arthrobacter sp. YJM1]